MKLKELVEQYGEYEIYTDSPNHVVNAFKDLDSKDDGVLCLFAKKPKQKPRTVWDLERGDRHCWVDITGAICTDVKWRDDEEDKLSRAMGYVFLTEEEANREVERRKVETLLLKYGGRRWRSSEKPNCFIWFDLDKNSIDVVYDISVHPLGVILFDTKEQAEKAVEEIGEERIKKALFEVRE